MGLGDPPRELPVPAVEEGRGDGERDRPRVEVHRELYVRAGEVHRRLPPRQFPLERLPQLPIHIAPERFGPRGGEPLSEELLHRLVAGGEAHAEEERGELPIPNEFGRLAGPRSEGRPQALADPAPSLGDRRPAAGCGTEDPPPLRIGDTGAQPSEASPEAPIADRPRGGKRGGEFERVHEGDYRG